ncbi:MAG: SDR family NAD(P)-dependent oxidoreductase [Gammaproteobacteria bacterium]|nr:SDR family NAD(P)-dependent oxidoreductase [Gammaproteobacteria bacterium]
MENPQSILITGATSGLGAGLAVAYAAPGVTLALSGRNATRLDAIVKECRARGAEVSSAVLDVQDVGKMREWVLACDAARPLDLVIANAGISNAGTDYGEEKEREVFAVNLFGVLNTVYPAMPLMKKRGRGQIVVMSSLASMLGIARAPAYSASKAAVKTFGEALRKKLRRYGVEVSVICPGFVKTPLTDVNNFGMPFLMSLEKAVPIMVGGLRKNRGLIAFPWIMYFPLWFLRLLPHKWAEYLTRHV